MKAKKLTIYAMSALLTAITLSSCKSDEQIDTEVVPNTDISELRTTAYASDKSISREEAERRLAIMDEAHKSFPEMEEYLRGSMTGSYFDFQDGEFSLNVRTTLKQEVPSILDEQFMQKIKSESGLPVTMHFNSIMDAKSIDNMLENEATVLFSNMKGVQNFGYNPKKDMVSLYVYEPDELKKEEWLDNKDLQNISGMDIEIIFEPQPTTTAALIGGGDLNVIPVNDFYDNIVKCTAGYSATRNGVYGVITAAHCGTRNKELGSKLRYIGLDSRSNRYDMTLTGYDSNQSTGRYHDLAFFEADDRTATALPLFFTENSTDNIKTFYSPVNASVGSFACHYGRSTDFSCGEVTSTNMTNVNTSTNKGCASSLPCANTFVRVQGAGLKCLGGDSGGPVFGLLPYGIASSCNVNAVGNATLYYSPLRFASYIGATPLVAQ